MKSKDYSKITPSGNRSYRKQNIKCYIKMTEKIESNDIDKNGRDKLNNEKINDIILSNNKTNLVNIGDIVKIKLNQEEILTLKLQKDYNDKANLNDINNGIVFVDFGSIYYKSLINTDSPYLIINGEDVEILSINGISLKSKVKTLHK